MKVHEAVDALRRALPADAMFLIDRSATFTRFNNGQKTRERSVRVSVNYGSFVRSVSAASVDEAVESMISAFDHWSGEQDQIETARVARVFAMPRSKKRGEPR